MSWLVNCKECGVWKDGKKNCRCGNGDNLIASEVRYTVSDCVRKGYLQKIVAAFVRSLPDFGCCSEIRERVADGEHASVTVLFKCSECTDNIAITYEYGSTGNGKRAGLYKKFNSDQSERFFLNIQLSQDVVNSVLGSLLWNPEEYHLGTNDCFCWAKQFYAKLKERNGQEKEKEAEGLPVILDCFRQAEQFFEVQLE